MIQVNVTGKAGSGKSTVALVIAKALREAGINTTVQFLDSETESFVEQNLDRKLANIAERQTVFIVEACSARAGA